jgi:lysophospholipase L1-like esterase
MQELIKRVGRTNNLTAAEVDSNFIAVETAVGALALTSTRANGWLNNPIVVSRFSAPNLGWSDGTQVSTTYKIFYTVTESCIGLQFHFGNWNLTNGGNSGAGEVDGLNPITIKVYCYQFGYLTFNGQSSVTLEGGASIKSDPLPVFHTPTGPTYALAVNVSVATLGQKWPLGYQTRPSAQEGHKEGPDESFGGYSLDGSAAFAPFAVTGTLVVPRTYASVAVFGDSIYAGVGETEELGLGWPLRGLDSIGASWVRCAVGGGKMDTLFNITTANYHRAYGLTHMSGIQVALCGFGANDLFGFDTFETAKAAYLSFWTALALMGMRVVASTVLPRNEFDDTRKAIRVQINDWIRTTPTPLSGYVEAADLAETGRNSNVWKTGYSGDGVHPSSAGAAAISVAITNTAILFHV